MNSIQAALILLRLGHAGVAKPLAELVDDLVAGRLNVTDLALAYQVYHGLTQTGSLDDVLPHLELPRCGHPDVMADSTVPCRWPDPNVTYHSTIALSQIPADRVQEIYEQAWNQWAAVSGLNPKPCYTPATGKVVNVNARAGSGAADSFDAAGTVLAWSQLPLDAQVNTQLNQVFNAAEAWTEAMFLAVACHEIGHAIGLSHSPGECLMNPYYNAAITAPTPIDAANAVALYGPAQPQPVPPLVPSAPPQPTPSEPTPTPPAGANPPAVPPGPAASFILDVPVPGKYLVTITQQQDHA